MAVSVPLTLPLLVTSSATSNHMGHECCGGQGHKNNKVFTNQYHSNVERSALRREKINQILELAGKDAVFFIEELNAMNRAGNEVIANNHQLRSEIYDLKSKVAMLEEKVYRLSHAINEEEFNKAKNFPFDTEFRPTC